MLPDRVSNPGPLTYESGALPIALRDPARDIIYVKLDIVFSINHQLNETISRKFYFLKQ